MYNSYIGICKFIMSLFVVAIHVQPFSDNMAFYHNNCIARIADPVFFTLSAYFLFDKLIRNNWNQDVFFKQIKHLFKYYFVWLVVFSPVILSKTWYQTNNILDFGYEILKQVFLSGTYGALWFLPALLLGLILTYLVGKRCSPQICLAISFPFFLLTILQMEYTSLIQGISWLTIINDFFVSIFGWLGNGVNYGFFFCTLGLYLASQKQKIRNNKFDVAMFLLFSFLLVGECTIIRHFDLGISYGAMFFLIPVSYYLIQILLRLKPKNNADLESAARYLQNMSLLIFPLHYGTMEALAYLLKNITWYTSSSTIQYFSVIIVTLVISALILFLSKKYRFLRYLYGK